MARRSWIAACVLVAACGGGDGGGPIAIGSLQASYNAYLCNLAVRCGLVADLATCSKLKLGSDSIVSPDLVAAVEAGTVVYDGAAAETCLAALTSTCDRSLVLMNRDSPAACDEMFAGTVGAGGACAIDQECISQVCDVPGCTMACCQGTCFGDAAPVRPVAGESCSTNQNCLQSYCDTSTYTCAPYLASGASCTNDSQCAIGLACPRGTCQALVATGGTCTSASDCRSIGDFCSGTKCTAYGVAGDPCTSDGECSNEYRCDLTMAMGTCVLRPVVGETCGSSPLDCVDRSYCDPATSKCTALLADGSTCNSSSQCASSHCDFTTSIGTCTTPPVCI